MCPQLLRESLNQEKKFGGHGSLEAYNAAVEELANDKAISIARALELMTERQRKKRTTLLAKADDCVLKYDDVEKIKRGKS